MKAKTKKVIIISIMILVIFLTVMGIIYMILPTTSNSDIPTDEVKEVTEDNTISLETATAGDGYEIKDGNMYITKGGTYRITGALENGSVIIDADEQDVTLELSGVTIMSDHSAGIVATNIHQLTITTLDNTTNQVTDGGNSEYDAAIFSSGNLILDGTGTLIVKGNVEEGIATENADITIESGIYDITSKDDGINAGGDGGVITINGGTFHIYAEGDGIDSNQDLIINDGILFVEAANAGDNAAFDCDGAYQINGGTVIGLGMGMMQNPDSDGKANTILWNFTSQLAGNTMYSIYKNGSELLSFYAEADYQTLTISHTDITADTYTVYAGGTHTGTLTYGIYQEGSYTTGSLVSINGITEYQVTHPITRFGNAR